MRLKKRPIPRFRPNTVALDDLTSLNFDTFQQQCRHDDKFSYVNHHCNNLLLEFSPEISKRS